MGQILGFSPEQISAGADIGLLLVALSAAVVALHQISVNRDQIRTNREIEALNAYEKYHHLSLEYPKLATGFDHNKCAREEFTQYEFFVMCMLLTIERVLTLYPNDASWRAAFVDDLVRHKTFLCSKEFIEHLSSFDEKVVDLIQSVATELDWTYPWRAPETRSSDAP